MPIEPLVEALYEYVRIYQQQKRIDIQNLHAVGRVKGYTHRDVGYAIQILRKKNKINYYPKYGWKVV